MSLDAFRQLINYRELLWSWTVREVHSRYRQSVLGVLWAIIQPLVLMVAFTIIFSEFLKVPTNEVPYPIFSFSALIFWTLFSTSIAFGTNSLVNNMALLRKIYFPREILPLASISASFVDFLIAAAIFIVMYLLYGMPLRVSMVWVFPLLIVQLMLTLGVVAFSSSLNVYYRDLRSAILSGTTPEWSLIWPSVLISTVLFISGYIFFKRVEWAFADVV